MSKKFINEIKVNERIDSFFMLRKKKLKLTKYDKPYLELGLSDKTGKIEGRLWDDADKFNEEAETGDVVRVIGTIDKFREEKQIKVDSIEKADDRAYRFEDMVRVVENRERIFDKTISFLRDIKNPWVLALAEEFIKDRDLMGKFMDGIGAKNWHNAYIGGLLEHTHEVMFITHEMCDLCPEADRDIALFGAFVHDIGKICELDPKKLEYTIEGGLLGHISIGHNILMEKIRNIPDFPYELRLRIEHIILSHHGEYEQQSPVLPKTIEATIVYHTDELVSQTNAVKEIQKREADEGKVWSNYVSIKGRKYYIKHAEDEDWKQTAQSNDGKEQGKRSKGNRSGKDQDLFNGSK